MEKTGNKSQARPEEGAQVERIAFLQEEYESVGVVGLDGSGWLAAHWKECVRRGLAYVAKRNRRYSMDESAEYVLTPTDYEDIVQQAARYWFTTGETQVFTNAWRKAQEEDAQLEDVLRRYWYGYLRKALIRWRTSTGRVVSVQVPESTPSRDSAEDLTELVMTVKALRIGVNAKKALLYTMLGFRQEEIASKLGIDRSVVSRHLHNARTALQQVLTS